MEYENHGRMPTSSSLSFGYSYSMLMDGMVAMATADDAIVWVFT